MMSYYKERHERGEIATDNQGAWPGPGNSYWQLHSLSLVVLVSLKTPRIIKQLQVLTCFMQDLLLAGSKLLLCLLPECWLLPVGVAVGSNLISISMQT